MDNLKKNLTFTLGNKDIKLTSHIKRGIYVDIILRNIGLENMKMSQTVNKGKNLKTTKKLSF